MNNKDKKIIGYDQNTGFPIYGNNGEIKKTTESIKKNIFSLNCIISISLLIIQLILVIFSNYYFPYYAINYELNSMMYKRCFNVAHIGVSLFVFLGMYYQGLIFIEITRGDKINRIKYLLLNIIPFVIFVTLFFILAFNYIK